MKTKFSIFLLGVFMAHLSFSTIPLFANEPAVISSNDGYSLVENKSLMTNDELYAILLAHQNTEDLSSVLKEALEVKSSYKSKMKGREPFLNVDEKDNVGHIQNGITYNIDNEGLKRVTFYEDTIKLENLSVVEKLGVSGNRYKTASNTVDFINKFLGYKLWTAYVKANFGYNGVKAWTEDVDGGYTTYNLIGGIWRVENERSGSVAIQGGAYSRAYYRGNFYFAIGIDLGKGNIEIRPQQVPLDLRVSCSKTGVIYGNDPSQ